MQGTVKYILRRRKHVSSGGSLIKSSVVQKNQNELIKANYLSKLSLRIEKD